MMDSVEKEMMSNIAKEMVDGSERPLKLPIGHSHLPRGVAIQRP